MSSAKRTEIARTARKLMDQHGLTTWAFGWNRNRSSIGVCIYRPQRIEISELFAARLPMDEIRDTILHEIAHALAGNAAGHGPHWQRIARQIGAQPERCSTSSAAHDAYKATAKWRIDCTDCGQTVAHRQRLTKAMRTRHVSSCCKAELSFTELR